MIAADSDTREGAKPIANPAGPFVAERVRFSPSPSGALHLGGARTALFNWLVARRSGGAFIVRIEDTDAARSTAESEAAIIEDLAWLGLDWDEGPEVGGGHGPYRQSERQAAGIYVSALADLVAADAVYPCFCTVEQLASARGAEQEAGAAPHYEGACAALPADEARRRMDAGEPAAWRFRVRPGAAVTFDDVVHGVVSIERESIGDFVVVRSDGAPVYDLAAAVDDGAMGITLVVRGDDHLSNTARQIVVAEALGLQPPRFAHVPLVHGADGRPLSKRRGAISISGLREKGYLAEAVINHAALLGWSHPGHEEVLSREELVAAFDLARVGRAPAQHDASRLDWLNERHIRALPPERLQREVSRVLPAALPPWFAVGAFAEGIRDEITTFSQASALAMPLLDPPSAAGEAAEALGSPGGRIALAIASAAFDAGMRSGEDVVSALRRDLADAGIAPRQGMPAVRAALTGCAHGLPLALLIEVIGWNESRSRLRAATM